MSAARWLVPLLVLASASAWRFGPDWLGFAASAATLSVALVTGFGSRPSPALQCVLAVLGAAIAALGLVEAWWPCELACSAGESYATLFEWPVALLAAVSLVLLALVSFRATPDAGRHRVGRAGAWLLAGVSAYYCGLSVQLDMVCGHCLSVHTAVFCTAFLALGGIGMATGGVLLAAIAAVGLHTLYNPGWYQDEGPAVPAADGREPPDPDAVERTPTNTDAGTADRIEVTTWRQRLQGDDLALAERIDQSRRLGPEAAPLVVEFVHAFTCSHCSKQHGPTIGALKRLAQEGKVQLVLRHSVSMRNSDGVELAKLAFAAAAHGIYEEFGQKAFGTLRAPVKFGESVRGSRSRRVLNRLEEVMDLEPLRDWIAREPTVFEALVEEEARVIHVLEAGGELPRVFLLDQDGEILFQAHGHEYRPSPVREEVVRQSALIERRAQGDGSRPQD